MSAATRPIRIEPTTLRPECHRPSPGMGVPIAVHNTAHRKRPWPPTARLGSSEVSIEAPSPDGSATRLGSDMCFLYANGDTPIVVVDETGSRIGAAVALEG